MDKFYEFCKDKWKTYEFFKENNILTPKTDLLTESSLKSYLTEFRSAIIKPRYGKKGIGVRLVKSIVEIKKDYLVQESIISKKTDKYFDIRVFHQRPGFFASYLRVSDNVITNLSQGGMAQELSYFDIDEKKIILEVEKIINFLSYDYYEFGVDILWKDNKAYFLELNYSPGLSGLIRLKRQKDMDIIYKNRLKDKGLSYVKERLSNFTNKEEKQRLEKVIICAA